MWAKQRLSRLGFYRNFFYYVAIFVVAICIVLGIKWINISIISIIIAIIIIIVIKAPFKIMSVNWDKHLSAESFTLNTTWKVSKYGTFSGPYFPVKLRIWTLFTQWKPLAINLLLLLLITTPFRYSYYLGGYKG